MKDELSKKELEKLAGVLGLKVISKDTKKTLVAKINECLAKMGQVIFPAKEEVEDLPHHEDMDFDEEIEGDEWIEKKSKVFKGFHPITGKKIA